MARSMMHDAGFAKVFVLGVLLLAAGSWLCAGGQSETPGKDSGLHGMASPDTAFSEGIPGPPGGLAEPDLPPGARDDKVQNRLLEGAWEVWSRQEDAAVLRPLPGGGEMLDHRGGKDWSWYQRQVIPVEPGEIWNLGATMWRDGEGSGRAALSIRNAAGEVTQWDASPAELRTAGEWQVQESLFVVPPDCKSIQFRFSGDGPGRFGAVRPWLVRIGRATPAPDAPLVLEEGGTSPRSLRVDARKGVMVLSGKAREWTFRLPALSTGWILGNAEKQEGRQTLSWEWIDSAGTRCRVKAWFGPDGVEMDLDLTGQEREYAEFPGILAGRPGESWVLPVNQGVLVPATDQEFRTWDMVLYGGHGLCMPFLGLQDAASCLGVVVDTADDALVHFDGPRREGSSFSLRWQPSLGSWRYPRHLVLMDLEGDYNRLAKAYRARRDKQAPTRTLAQKRSGVPRLADMAGAVNLWWWKNGPWWTEDDRAGVAAITRDLKTAGVDRVLWSHGQDGPTVDDLNKAGFVSGIYDIYQDVWGPDNPHAWVHREGWPESLVWERNGTPRQGWVDKSDDGEFPGGVICSGQALEVARTRMAADLETHAYAARFLDTTTASPLIECWNPAHPQTRSQDRQNRMALLDMASRTYRMVTGSETGTDMAVDHLHYFEGMMSLGPWRPEDAGYDLFKPWNPDRGFRLFQTGGGYRIPLFELVWHDCVMDSWYWGDSSNRVREFWDEKDLLNALYGTMPLWAVDPQLWKAHRERFLLSWRNATMVSRQVAFTTLERHRRLTGDGVLQESLFGDGTRVLGNFDTRDRTAPDGTVVPARGFRVFFPDGRTASSRPGE